ncbi:tyrosine-protein phosphatase non-receptor type 18-like isoform X11 [Littorina saxatilis]|uniref:tyrosine-protein phosphatase non-receptor type 18-like isoform X11 n=1 Tax=Littorina saxatilis TaxID=31220 RepID=UPI0038B54D4D
MSKDIEDILKEFIGHVSDLKTEDDPAGTGFHREFRSLREIQTQNKSEDTFPTEDGKKEENVKKNRYKDILPRDDKRVKLTEIPGEKGSDYINATFIEDVHGQNGYIAAQGPMPHTVNDFWRMLWEQNTEIVFMACRMKEDGRAKCEKYWGDNGESATFGEITVYTLSEEEIQEHFIKRDLRAEKKGQKHHLVQFHYTGWPDHNTPSSPDALRCMIEEVRDFRKKMKVPMVVHCSAGCGRTGTICAIDHAWTLLDKGMIEEGFSMFEIIKSLREQRMSMVQTPDQYEYTHMVMKSLCDEWLVSFATRDYENVTIGPPPTEFAPEPPEEVYNNIEMNGNKNDDRDQSMAYYANNVPAMAATPTEDGPALPDRLYKPEEAKTDQREKHNYDNVERTTTQPTKSSSSSSSSSSQTSSPTSTLPHSQGQTRALQAIPKNQNPPASVPVQVVKIPGATGGGHGTQGWVTAMGGLPPERAIPTRRVSEKSRGHPTQPTGPTVVKTTQSKPGLLKRLKPNKKPRGPPGPSQPVAAPVPPPGGVHISKSGKKIVFFTERPQRVSGPRDMPAQWTKVTNNHSRSTYL